MHGKDNSSIGIVFDTDWTVDVDRYDSVSLYGFAHYCT